MLQKGLQKRYFSSLLNLGGLSFDKQPIIDPKYNGQKFDLAVIGGGSGGIALAYEAKKQGLNTVVFDFVEPSTQGTKWGIGGTCVNVGCIPKKLFHTAGIMNENFELSEGYGFSYENKQFSWPSLVNQVQTYIKSNNFGYKQELQNLGIPYINALASIKDQNTVVYSPEKSEINQFLQDNQYENKEKLGQISFKNVVIATGGRPAFLSESQCSGMYQHAITSDDIFAQKKEPGKTLVVGGGYIGLECAGFLKSLGYDVSIMTRGLYLRTMDRQSVDQILDYMENVQKLNFIHTSLPTKIDRINENELIVDWQNQKNKELIGQDTFNTVIAAVSRNPNVKNLNLQNVGVEQNEHNQKIKGNFNNELEQTSQENIYAIGDVLEGVPELTPAASKSGILLAKRIANKELNKKQKSKYVYFDSSVPTTVFTPLEYGFVGLSEEEAVQKYGEENIEIYLSKNSPLEEALSVKTNEKLETIKKKSFFKIICDKNNDEKVIGIHYVGPNAGEILQGFSVAFKIGMTKDDLDNTIGIHPTIAEELVNLKITKASGKEFEKTSC